MNKIFVKTCSVLLALSLTAGAAPAITSAVQASAAVTDGQVKSKSDDYTWSFDDETDTLSFIGSGTLSDGDWKAYKDSAKSVILGEGVGLSYASFSDWTALESVTLPEGLGLIPFFAFSGCKSLKSVVIPEGVTQIGDSTFKDCTALTKIVFSDTVEKISDYAFKGCTGLKTVTFGKKLASIGRSSFFGCTALTSVKLPSSVKEIMEYAFSDCAKLASVTLSSGIEKIGVEAFLGTAFAGNTKNFVNGVLYCGKYALSADNALLPASLTLKSGTETIANSAFLNCTALQKVVLPASLRHIGTMAFSKCKNLTDVTFNDGLVSIEAYAFEKCAKLKAAKLSDSVEFIGPAAFDGCKALAELTLPDGLTEIGYNTFRSCSALKKIVFPSTLKSIGDGAFENVHAECTIPDSVYCVDKGVFAGTLLEDSADPRENGIYYAGNHAQGIDERTCSETIKIKDGTVSLAPNFMVSSDKVRTVILPESVVSATWNAFGGKNIKKIVIANPECAFYEQYCSFPENAEIYGVKGSAVEAYAEKFGREFYPIECFEGHDCVITKATTTKDGTQEKTCKVCGAKNSSETIPAVSNITLSKDSYICHNIACCPNVTVKDAKGNRLVRDTDYTVTYKNNVNVGTATATVKLIGEKYSGTKTLKYSINLANVYGFKTASRTDSTVTLKWNAVDGAVTYRIYKYSAADDKYTQIGTTKNTQYTVKDLKDGTKYTFCIKASKTVDGVTYMSESYQRTNTYTAPANVKGLKASSQTTASVKLSWSKVSGASGYRIYRYNSATKKYVRIGSTTGTSYTLKDLKAGTVYTRYVKAVKTISGNIVLSPDYVKVKTATKPSAPKTPSLTAGAKKITAKWSKPTGATGCELYMKKGSSGTYSRIYYGSKTSCTKTSLKTGSTCYFKVRAYKTVNGEKIYSAYSKTVNVKAK